MQGTAILSLCILGVHNPIEKESWLFETKKALHKQQSRYFDVRKKIPELGLEIDEYDALEKMCTHLVYSKLSLGVFCPDGQREQVIEYIKAIASTANPDWKLLPNDSLHLWDFLGSMPMQFGEYQKIFKKHFLMKRSPVQECGNPCSFGC